MPASMMSEPTGSVWKVIGNRMAMVASGPMPGSTPIRVPTKQPIRQSRIFVTEKATENPSARLWTRSGIGGAGRTIGGDQAGDGSEQQIGGPQYAVGAQQ